jgi:serine/threonine protein kinase/WD40 repeat protein
MSDTTSGSGRDPVELLLESFLARWRRGERPSPEEYAARCPERSDEIRELFPALVEMEQLKPSDKVATGPVARPTPRPESAAGPAPPHPERLGDYRILRIIGEGGMGVVYEAEHEALKSRVALKVMHPRFRADRTYLRRFQIEARSAARLHHTNIVSVFDFGQQDGICYYAMQYIAGVGLHDVLEDVRRLRATADGASPARAGEPGDNQPTEAGDGPVWAVAHGLLTGRFVTTPATPGGSSPAATASVDPEPADQAAAVAAAARPTAAHATATDGASQAGTGGKGDDQPTEPVDAPISAVAHSLLTGRFANDPDTLGGWNPAPTTSLGPHQADQAALVVPPARPPAAPAIATPDGGSGSNSLAGRPEFIYFREIARLGAQVADALDYAHRQNVVHRDIKASNLLLDAQGNVWVTDFGLAKLVEGDDLSQSRDVVGTLRYMAPERFRGVTDRRGDIYALGATLYELLALRPAFPERDQVRLIDQIAHEPPAPLRQHDRRIPRDLETIVLKVLSKDPKDRCENAGELRDELRRFLEGRPTRWRRVGTVEQLRRWCKRNPLVAGLGALAATLMILTAVVSTVAAWRFKRDGEAVRSALRNSYLSEARALRWSGREGRRFAALDAVAKAAKIRPGPDLRDEAIASMALTDLRVLPEWEVVAPTPLWLAFDAALERYARSDDRGDISIRRVADHREVLRLPGPGYPAWVPRFSPDGRYLAAAYHSSDRPEPKRLLVWHLERGRPVVDLAFGESSGHGDFSPDSSRLAVGRREGSISIFELESGREVMKLGQGPMPSAIAWHPDGTKLAAADGPIRGIRVYDSATGRRLFDLQHEPYAGRDVSLAWSPDGTKLAQTWPNGRISIWDALNPGRPLILSGHTGKATQVAFSHRGDILATTGWDKTIRLWDPLTGQQLVSTPGTFGVRFSPDDRWLGFSIEGASLRLCEVAASRAARTWPLPKEPRCVHFSPDGRLMAAASDDGVRLWDVATAKPIAFWTVPGLVSALFQPDGRGLITSGASGLQRWPIAVDGTAGPLGLRIQSSQTFEAPTFHSPTGLSLAADGRTLAVTNRPHSQAVVFDLRTGKVLFRGEQPGACTIAISPDGRWLASSPWGGPAEVKVWDL